MNGFDLRNASIPPKEIHAGGPPRDGIPSIDRPVFVGSGEADFLRADDRVLGVVMSGVARAYPLKILNWHEIVNDSIGGQHFVVTYCPLCGSGMVFDSNIDGTALTFGVSGLLYDSDMLLYDRNTDSLWSQIKSEAVSGPLRGTRLQLLPSRHTTWSQWRSEYPATVVLSTDTGYRRDYQKSPYGGYEKSPNLYFHVSNKAPRKYHPKTLVLGMTLGGRSKAYPFEELAAHGAERVVDTIGDEAITIHWDQASQSAHLTDASGAVLPATVAYWFAWYTFHPNTEVFTAAPGSD